MYKTHAIFVLLAAAALFFTQHANAEQGMDLEVTILSGASVKEPLTALYPEILPFAPGDTITWVNKDHTTHSITSGIPAHPQYSGQFFKSGSIAPSESYTTPVKSLNNFAYYYFCELHPWLTGKLVLTTAPESFPETENAIVAAKSYKKGQDIQVTGSVHEDFAKTSYEILVYQYPDKLVDVRNGKFDESASYSETISGDDVTSSKYTVKIVYGLPTQVATTTFQIEQDAIPDWIRSGAAWWASGDISDLEFISAIEYLAKEDIITLQKTGPSGDSKNVPAWIKTSAGWWADGKITDLEFTQGLQYLVNHGTIKI
ncbi:cupredoxin domain-containing protein [Candidatus Nitrosotenuis cloacae]|uniref:cupredoxin domain-containing protein n=1 Tax=Candidatus Nitrosotenuis cloacae TaxID=1603555 RepID=UPI002281F76C|nr:hypothetical protein [Candidatus Nitrosotenuis cloacae]